MGLTLSMDEFLSFTDAERDKWEQWFASKPASALEAMVQEGGRFPDVWSLMDHIFLVEKRHTQRLERVEVSTESGVPAMDAPALFAFGRTVRARLKTYISSLSDADAAQIHEFTMLTAKVSVSPRKLLFHIQIHEVRHWAQIASALRNAGLNPPGDHDLLFSQALR